MRSSGSARGEADKRSEDGGRKERRWSGGGKGRKVSSPQSHGEPRELELTKVVLIRNELLEKSVEIGEKKV